MGRGGNAGGPDASPSKPRDPKMQPAKVKMLDGTHKEFELHRGSHGDCLFQTVCSDLSIEEKDYFSLCFYDKEGVRHWLYNDKKILRQLKGLPWEFSYEVKFYPLNPSTLNDDHARYNMFLQLKNDVLKERLPATLPTQAILGSLVAQAEFGDAVASAEYEQFLQRARLAPNMNEQLMSQIRDLHKENKGQTSAEAECNYLDQCKQLSKYGVFLYPAKDDHNQAVDVGICATGINIYQGAIRIHRFHWQSINKISFRRNTFSVKLNAGEMGKKEVTLTYKVHDYAQAKRVWKCGVEHHTFFRLIQPDDKQKSGLLRFGSTKFRYQGRTQFQSKMASQMFDNSATNTVQRQSRLTQSCENVINATSPQPTTELAYTSNELELKPLPRSEQSYEISSAQKRSSTEKTKKPKKSKGLKEADSSDSSSSEDEHHRHAVTAMAANNDNELLGKKEIEQNIADQGAASFEDQDLPQHTQSVPEVPGSPTLALEVSSEETGPQQPLTTVASWQETSIMPDDVTIDYDEHGNKITRTVKTSQVKHTVQKQTVQSYVVPDENTPGVLSVEHNRDVMTPIGTTGSGPILETHSRSLVYEGQPISSDREDLGEFVSSKTITTGNRTVETVTYKREKNGIIETHVEHRVTIHSNTDIDHDAELSAAITEATQMNPDMIVEKIEVRQESSN